MAVVAIRVIGFFPQRVVGAFGAGVGRLGGRLFPRKRSRIRENLVAAGADNVDRGVGRACAHLGRTILEMVWTLTQSPERAWRHVIVENIDSLREAVEAGRGVLLVAGHLGNWELIPPLAARAGFPVAVVARKLSATRVEKKMLACRQRAGVQSLIHGERPVKAYRWLAKGGVLGCMIDRSIGKRRMRIPLLGRQAHVPLGPTDMAARLGSRVILATAKRRDDGTTVVRFESVDCAGDAEQMMRTIGAALDAELHSCPEQWFWIYRRSGANP